MVNIIAGTRQDFDGLAVTFNDTTWSRDNMQKYFRLIEDNLYLVPALSPDHGFDGWLKTSLLPLDVLVADPLFLDVQTAALITSLQLGGLPVLDLNDIAGDDAKGVNSLSFTVDENHIRSSVHERLLAAQQSNPNQLHMALNTLATKILLCESDSSVSAYGTSLNVKNVTAKYEVIVSAGTFQSPQLLMLSGIGDQNQLQQYGIEPVLHLPGVGTNLQDHDEVAINWRMKNDYALLKECKFLSDPSQDPCLKDWLEPDHDSPYAFAGALDVIITQSDSSLPAPDVLTYIAPVLFPGFFRSAPYDVANNPNALTAVVLKGHPSSRGTVQLTGSHPQDLLNIQKLHFQESGGPADIAALREGIKRARRSNITTDDEIDEWILTRVFGHHACCTNAMGPDSDPNAVLDGNFKVRGVDNLRVVGASSWPNVPGFFITTPTYMMSEKAADVIIAATRTL
ncbi:hypothetical protein H0H92_011286 [Tricholoma furcatifolium]|nr:hypothetical protein H0H92_011286 [Tricholoma furcatifolium]